MGEVDVTSSVERCSFVKDGDVLCCPFRIGAELAIVGGGDVSFSALVAGEVFSACFTTGGILFVWMVSGSSGSGKRCVESESKGGERRAPSAKQKVKLFSNVR